ncbi:MAG TPA: site-2 protease family protein, partial [Candidatus Thermoplasmatota archaeon]|nr:site-2 protease family protein [Candidatus Thermoplasmatota archaeon]
EEDAYLGVYPFRQDNVAFAQQPFGGDCDGTGARRPFCEMAGFLTLIALPVGEVRGAPYLSTYFPMFLETPFDGDVFWPLVTLAFWMFWINLMVGLTNILPMLPLDGGHIFRDAVGGAAAKAAPNASEEKRMRFVNRAAVTVSFLILGAFLLQIFGPRLVQ